MGILWGCFGFPLGVSGLGFRVLDACPNTRSRVGSRRPEGVVRPHASFKDPRVLLLHFLHGPQKTCHGTQNLVTVRPALDLYWGRGSD